MIKRRYDFDWIRTLVIINLIPFHVIWLMLFFPGPSQTGGDGVIATLLQAYMVEVAPWHMPLLFVIAGYSAAISLTRRSTNQYLRERLQRLAVPLAFYIAVIGPIMRYFWPGRNSSRGFTDFVLIFLPSHFKALTPCCYFDHLWFIFYLLLFNLTVLPMLAKITVERLRGMTAYIRHHIIWVPMAIFAIAMATVGWYWPLLLQDPDLIHDWGYFTYNLFAFTVGYLLFIDRSLETIVHSQLRLWIALFLGSSITRIVLLIQYQENFYDAPGFGQHLFFSIITGTHVWSAIGLMLALGHRYLANIDNSFVHYMKNASLPFYILHWPILLILGTYLLPLGLGFLPSFFLLILLTALITTLIYQILVKPWSFIQFLLGVKIKTTKV